MMSSQVLHVVLLVPTAWNDMQSRPRFFLAGLVSVSVSLRSNLGVERVTLHYGLWDVSYSLGLNVQVER